MVLVLLLSDRRSNLDWIQYFCAAGFGLFRCNLNSLLALKTRKRCYGISLSLLDRSFQSSLKTSTCSLLLEFRSALLCAMCRYLSNSSFILPLNVYYLVPLFSSVFSNFTPYFCTTPCDELFSNLTLEISECDCFCLYVCCDPT